MRAFRYPRLLLCVSIVVSPLALIPPLRAQSQSLATPRITEPVNNSSLVRLKGTVAPLANAANDAGPASPDMQVQRIQLALKRSPEQESDLRQLIDGMHTPGSPNYHKWLTPAQFGQRFGPADQDIQAIEAWVQSRGFQVGALDPGKATLEISGTIGQLQNAFHTSIHKYMVGGEQHYANATDPEIPAALAPVLSGFVSLNNFPVHRLSRVLGKASYDPKTNQAIPQWTQTDGTSPLGYDLVMAPQDFDAQYNINPLLTAGTNGNGQTIAIVNDSNINVDFVNNFRTLFGLPPNPPQVIIDGNDPGIDGINNPDGPNGDSIEAYLDVEWSGAVAPYAKIDLVVGADTALASGLILAAQNAIANDLAPVLSLSFGACETSLGSGNQFLSNLWEQAAAEGITVLVASGDNGSAGCDNPNVSNVSNGTVAESGLAVSGYASTPFNVAVGGTDFYYSAYAQGKSAVITQLGTYWNLAPTSTPQTSLTTPPIPEQPWNESQFGLNIFTSPNSSIVAGSGGPSTCGIPTLNPTTGAVAACAPYPKPSWQVGAGVPADGARDLPDISLFAADGFNNSFFPICASDGDCQSGATPVQITGVGGTSGSAPAMAGIMALVNQKYGPQGQADYVLYPLAVQHPSAFHDVTVGTNAVPCAAGSLNCSSNGELSGYAAAPGYDLATGLGSIDAYQLVTNWNSISFKSSTTALTVSPTSFTHGATVSVTANVTAPGGTPAGSVSLMTDSPAIYQQSKTTLPLTNGSASFSVNFLPGGTYNVWGQYGGDGTNGPSTSSKTQITVSPESSSLIFSIATPSSNGGYSLISAGETIPYGTPIILDGQAVPTSYYNNCQGGSSTSTACQNATFAGATGTVAFTDNNVAINTAPINAEGDAEFSSGGYALGAHTLTAAYSGDASYKTSTASPFTFIVAQAPASNVTVTVNSNQSSIAQGQTLVLSVVVEGGGIGAAPTGTVKFANGTTTLGSATLAAGVDPTTGSPAGIGTLSLPNLSAGTQNILAVYSGDSNYAGVTSNAYKVTITGASGLLASTTTGSASASSTSPTARITLTATVTGQAGHPAPTGTIDFQTPTSDFGKLSLSPGSGDTSTVSVHVNSQILLQGVNAFTLQYSGDSNYQASSATLTINNPLSDFSMVALQPVLTVTGGSATSTLNFAAVNGFSGAVALTCAAPSGLTCSLNPNSVTLTPSTAALHHPNQPGWFLASGGATLACVFLLGLPDRRRKWRSLLGLMVIAILTAGIGCGGGSGNSGGGGGGGGGNTPAAPTGPAAVSAALAVTVPPGTPAGNYTVVVTGTPSQGLAITHNVAIIVKLQ